MSRFAFLLATAFFVAIGGLSTLPTASAQDAASLDEFYGVGVHAYYQRQYMKAHDSLSVVINSGSRDPRPYYFRAMANLAIGNSDEARFDMARGAELESLDVDGNYNVARALERVQGRSRLSLERHRLKARLANYRRLQQRNLDRYEQIEKQDEQVLRNQVDVPLGGVPNNAAPVPAGDPFAESAAGKAAAPADEPPMEEMPADEPVAEAPAAEAPASDDPFGEPDADDASAADDDPFGAPVGDDEPAMEEPAADDDDPFADTGGAAPPPDSAGSGKVSTGILGRVLGRAIGRGLAGDEAVADEAAPVGKKAPVDGAPKPVEADPAGDPFGDDGLDMQEPSDDDPFG